MGKAKQNNTTKVDPWLPSRGEWNALTTRAGQTITPQFQRALLGAQGYLNRADNAPLSGAGVTQTLMGAMSGSGMDQMFDQTTQQAQNPQYAQNFLSTMSAAQDPNARSAAFDQVRQNAIADIMPEINSTFAGSGMTGSSLHQRNLAKGLSAGIAGVENQAYQQGMDRALQAAQAGQSSLLQSAGMRQNAFDAGQGRGLQAAGMQNQIAGQGFNRLMALSNARQGIGTNFQNAYGGNLANMMSSATGGASRSTTQSSSPGLMGLLGAGLQVASLFSDRRLKTDIRRVGALDDGTPVYTYRYAHGGPVHMGVMADEIEKTRPGAVSTGDDGFCRVNYGAV